MKNPVTLEITKEKIAVVTMQDTEGQNVFSDYLINGLIRVVDELEEKHRPPVMVLRGLPDVFSGGAEKDTLIGLAEGKLHVKDLLVSERLVNTPFPVIAAMEGHAVGGGLIMAVCCDIVVAALESRYGAVFMNMGFTPGMGCTTLLQELVGPYIANEMMFTGRRFKGKELAGKSTNINYILPKIEVMGKAMDVALQVAEKNIESVYLLKYALSARKKKLLIDARVQEDFMHRLSFGFPETKETIKNFYVE
ncbi:MAG: enoyl-CoA hydratase/isomerase family protein [Spirochaetales bacterium]|nr:enoyl-CoA hydratase/isomerase family protein [Spirochaetales bacterium]